MSPTPPTEMILLIEKEKLLNKKQWSILQQKDSPNLKSRNVIKFCPLVGSETQMQSLKNTYWIYQNETPNLDILILNYFTQVRLE